MIKKQIILLVIASLFSFVATLFAESANAASNSIDLTLTKYQKSKLIKMNFEKKISSDVSRDKTYKGTAFIGVKKLFIENNEPDHTKIIYDGKVLTNVQYPPKEFGGDPQVAQKTVDLKNGSDYMLTLLNNPEVFNKTFEIVGEEKVESKIKFKLKSKKSETQFRKIFFTIEPQKLEISRIEFDDEVENHTEINFSKIQFDVKEPKNLFKFQIPKNAQVIHL